ncbi:hypothetical protein ABW20_dc0102367 [Dactylellina cionopaga]|nr:hypothetical protein ABW20_dc0102367 [Dactylellina cionopaga]
MSAIATALGAVIGYLGAEVAEESTFERLLWPQRFYNDFTLACSAKWALFMPTCGPLHRAALSTLDMFRDHGLYRGRRCGDMLGTPFFADNPTIRYKTHTPDKHGKLYTEKAVRNGFWVETLKSVIADLNHNDPMLFDIESVGPSPSNSFPSSEKSQATSFAPYQLRRKVDKKVRAYRPLFILDLEFPQEPIIGKNLKGVVVSENLVTWRTILGIFLSETSSIAVTIAVGLWHNYGGNKDTIPPLWLFAFFISPLALKLIAAAATLRREGLTKSKETLQPTDKKAIFEVECPSLGVVLLRTDTNSTAAALQFFRHYGHPIRDSTLDRTREIISILVVYAFVLHFPAGLALLNWMNEPTQYLWLFHQMYCVIVMHIVRICGWQGCGRTEELKAEIPKPSSDKSEGSYPTSSDVVKDYVIEYAFCISARLYKTFARKFLC